VRLAERKEGPMDQPLVKRCAAEFLGTLWLVFGGCGTAVFSIIWRGELDTVGLVGVSLAFGLTVVTGAYAVGHISGGHFNPAVTIGLSVAKRFAWKDAPAYVASQVLGGIAAAFLLWAIVIDVPQGGFSLEPGSLAGNGFRGTYYGLGGVLIAETFLTFMFLIVILGATHSKAVPGFGGLAIGLALTLIHLISIPISNTSVNPARSTGPAILEGGSSLTQLWAFWLAPIVGAVAAGIVYPWLRRDTSDELPVTAPADA
jgi:aquaporin Z